MSEWKTLKTKTIEVGANNFIELTLKKAPNCDNLLIGISKGWFSENKDKLYKTNILMSKEKIPELINSLLEVSKDGN